MEQICENIGAVSVGNGHQLTGGNESGAVGTKLLKLMTAPMWHGSLAPVALRGVVRGSMARSEKCIVKTITILKETSKFKTTLQILNQHVKSTCKITGKSTCKTKTAKTASDITTGIRQNKITSRI